MFERLCNIEKINNKDIIKELCITVQQMLSSNSHNSNNSSNSNKEKYKYIAYITLTTIIEQIEDFLELEKIFTKFIFEDYIHTNAKVRFATMQCIEVAASHFNEFSTKHASKIMIIFNQ